MSTDLEANSDLATHSLELVNRELGVTLDRARGEIEEYVDGQAGAAALQRAADLLHLASGALKIVEVHGAALLAEEMEHTCRFLADAQNAAHAEKGAEALTRSMVQLPAYLERLLSGGRDVALVLLPLLNDLRSARGKPLMSEGTLLLLRTGPLERPPRDHDSKQIATQANQQFRALAQQQRPQFQSALLGWIRGAQSEHNLDQLILITGTLEQAAQSKYVQQFWGVLCGVFVALRAGGLESSVALKRLIGQADRQLKRLADEGELAFKKSPPLDLLNNLLYYIARADCDDERIRAIRSDFDLNALIPGDAQLERAREGLAGPSVKLMRTVAEAIKQDLGTVKDSLDIFVRTGMQDLRQLLPQLEMLQKIGDTLSVLGLDSAQAKIRTQMLDLNSMVDASAEVDQEILERIAAALLSVEDDLDRELVRAVVPGDDRAPAPTESEAQYTQVTQAVMGECMVNLAKVKEAVVKLVDQPADTRALEQVRPQLRGIAAGLLMLNKTTVVRLIERIGNVLAQGLTAADGRADAQRVERLADAIVSVEYYMETVSAGRKDPWYMLENAARCLELLERQTLAAAPAAELPSVELDGEAVTAAEEEEEEAVAPEGVHDTVPQPVLKVKPPGVFATIESDEERTDPELLEIFIEEARSEIENIAASLPKWIDDPGDIENLTATRRSFHTLKGSGRTVGAQAIGDFAWSIENLLNRLINRTMVATPAVVSLVQEASAALPALLDQLELGIAPKIDTDALQRRADALAMGEAEAGVAEAGGVPSAAEVSGPAASIDPVLAEIFVKEMRGHLATIRDYLAKAERQPAPHSIDETLYRASHTLLGSANMANYAPCVVIAEPLSDFLSYCHQSGVKIDDGALATLRLAADAIQSVADGLAEQRTVVPQTSLVEGLRTLLEHARAAAAQEPEAVEPEFAPAEEEYEEQLPSEAAEFDPEIAAIFTEEAAEILDQAEMVVQDLRNGTNLVHGFGELQRLLHTLKGGARMAGIMPMGDLSHALETVLSGMAQDRLPTDATAIGLVQKTLDELQQMRDSVDLGRAFGGTPDRLLGELRAFAEGRAASADEVDEGHGAVMTGLLLETEGTTRPLEGKPRSQEQPRRVEPPRTEPPPVQQTPPVEHTPPAEELPFEEAVFSRSEIIEQSMNQPLDFDLTEVGLEDVFAESRKAETSVLPTLDDLAAESFDEPSLLDVTGTVEFSDEQMERLQALAFEESAAAAAAGDDTEGEDLTLPIPEELEAAALAGAPAEPVTVEDDARARSGLVTAADAEAIAEAFSESGAEEPPAPEAAPGEEAAEHAQRPRQPEPARAAERADTARVDAQLLDSLLNAAGEISIFQARLNQQLHSVDFHLGELGQTVTRLREQLRKLEAETEAEILFRHQEDSDHTQGFDPLELDRYSTIQQLSRALTETASDVASINELLLGLTHEADTLLTQQGRVTAEIQDGLMQTRMVPFQRHVARFARVVRQAAGDTGKAAELVVNGAHSELDRQVLDSMLPALEHLLRNSVVHGIEDKKERLARGKPESGRITLTLSREGAEVSIDVADDGAGLNLEAIARTALERGLIEDPQALTEKQAAELILMPGFSTAGKLTQSAGRGVGMDVVDNELKKLGGSMTIETKRGEGTRFHLRLPYTLAITHALIVDVGDETFALPLTTVEGITRVRREHLLELLTQDDPRLDYGELSYKLQHLGTLVGAAPSALPQDDSAVALVLVRAGDNSTALLTDHLEGSREVVVKGLGPHIASVPGVTGATILGDGRVIMILDPGTLIRKRPNRRAAAPTPRPKARSITALVVDDSITMRRVTERLLERRGVKVLTARDGLDAITVLQEHDPDIILLDIEMPRMDGYQFAAHVRNDAKFKDLPIIMITSRSGEKHRAKAIELGVNEYLSKPYQEQHLIAAIESQLGCEL